MFKEAIKSAIIGAVISTVMTVLVLGFIVGEKGVPDTVTANVMGNAVTAIICGGISGFASTITTFKLFEKKEKAAE